MRNLLRSTAAVASLLVAFSGISAAQYRGRPIGTHDRSITTYVNPPGYFRPFPTYGSYAQPRIYERTYIVPSRPAYPFPVFPSGIGYGSIYGTQHPGFGPYLDSYGPAWGSPYAWGW